jgi:hypothetical protein
VDGSFVLTKQCQQRKAWLKWEFESLHYLIWFGRNLIIIFLFADCPRSYDTYWINFLIRCGLQAGLVKITVTLSTRVLYYSLRSIISVADLVQSWLCTKSPHLLWIGGSSYSCYIFIFICSPTLLFLLSFCGYIILVPVIEWRGTFMMCASTAMNKVSLKHIRSRFT